MHSRIAGTGGYLPAQVLTNADLAQRIDTDDEWMRTRTGIRQRHIAAAGEQTSDLALLAAQRALAAAGIAPAEIDLIIVATTTPDMVFPSTACILQDKLGAKSGPAFDVQAVCCGFVYALSIADRMVAGGGARNALVVGAEIYSRILDWNDRGTCVLFGDGAGAAVLVPSRTPGDTVRAPARGRQLSQHPVGSRHRRQRRGQRQAAPDDGRPYGVQIRGESARRNGAGSAGGNRHDGGRHRLG